MISEKSEAVKNFLFSTFPLASCTLNYTKDYELVIAVMLSAQTTDAAVNLATAKLFSKYQKLQSLAEASIKDIYSYVSFLGLANVKAKNVIGIAQKLIENFNGVVPNDKEELTSLPGVGNKTANVVLAELFKIPVFPVDTHIHRISIRLNIVKEKDSLATVEEKLMKNFEKKDWISLHHMIIAFGRSICKAQNPLCFKCGLVKYCNYKSKNLSTSAR